MNKRDFFLLAMREGFYERRSWVISAFTQIQEAPNAWEADPYYGRIVQTPTQVYFVTADKTLEAIEGATLPVYDHLERLTLTPADQVPNIRTEQFTQGQLITTYGNLLLNYCVLITPFGNKVAYQNKRFKPATVEQLIVHRVIDDPASPDVDVAEGIENIEKTPITVSEYLHYRDACFYMTSFTQLWVPADTKKSLTPPPGLKEYRAQLLEEYKDRLHDPAAIAEIDAKLVAYDAQYLKGDAAEGFLISGKSRSTVRRKLFLSLGAEAGLDDAVTVDHIPTSLEEGWDLRKFSTLMNTQRAGSFGRSAQTELGGESVKWLLRVSSNMRVEDTDCGANLGVPVEFDAQNIAEYIGFSVVTAQGAKVITEEEQGQYLGKKMMVRSPQFCRLEKTDYCKVCAGPRLSLNPSAISSAVTKIGSTIMLIFMQASHGRNLTVAHMDINKELS